MTDERAKQMSQPREQRGAKGGKTGSSNQPQPTLRKGDTSDKTVRSVGPTFLPKR